jgi:hypothetical protein
MGKVLQAIQNFGVVFLEHPYAGLPASHMASRLPKLNPQPVCG